MLKVGSFLKSTGGAPASQAVTGVGFQPRALILWMAGGTSAGTFRASYYNAIGFVSGPSEVYSSSHAYQDNVNPTNASRRSAAKALTIVEWGEAVKAECDLTSFDPDGFTLNWTTNEGTAFIIHYLAIAGPMQAKAFGFTVPTSGITGNQAYTGVGFQPEVLLTLAHNSAAAIPDTRVRSAIRIGAGTSPSARWCVAAYADEGLAPGSSEARRVQRSNRILVANTATFTLAADLVSLDADGFTVNYITNSNGGGSYGALALRGLKVKVGTITKQATTTGNQAFTGIGFAPQGVLLASAMMATDDVSVSPVPSHSRMTMGAGSQGASECAAYQTAHLVGSGDAVDKTDKVYVKFDNDTQTIEAEASLASLDPDGFTLNWSTNDATTHDIPYIAFFVQPIRPQPSSLNIPPIPRVNRVARGVRKSRGASRRRVA